jgi:hypothetical protein
MLLAAVCVSAWIDNEFGGGNWWGATIEQVGALWLAGFVAGYIVGRLEAVLLALLPIVIALPFGIQDFPVNSIDPYFIGRERVADLMIPISLICAAFIAAGVIASVAVRFIRGREAPQRVEI